MGDARTGMEPRPYLLEGAAIGAVALVLGLAHLGLRADLAWVADPPAPDAASCAPEALPAVHLLPRISATELRNALDDAPQVTVVDARSEIAYAAGHIPGAVSLPADQADLILGVQSVPIPSQGRVVTYCDAARCESAEALGLKLQASLGCEQVEVLEGGWAQWLTERGPVAKGADDA